MNTETTKSGAYEAYPVFSQRMARIEVQTHIRKKALKSAIKIAFFSVVVGTIAAALFASCSLTTKHRRTDMVSKPPMIMEFTPVYVVPMPNVIPAVEQPERGYSA